MTDIRTTCENGLFCAFRQVGNYSITTRQRVQKNSSEDALLAILLALKSFAKPLGQRPSEWKPRWPVRAVGCAHFAPPTQRTRRDGLDHGRSVPLPVALGGDDYAFVPPAAPSSRTDRLCIPTALKKTPRFFNRTKPYFIIFRGPNLRPVYFVCIISVYISFA